MPREGYSFDVRGIEPKDLAFHDAPEEAKHAYWRAIVAIVLELKDKPLAAGLDRFGKPMHSITESTRREGFDRSYTRLGDPNAPPLTPAYGLSRTRALVRGRAFADHPEFFWAYDEVSHEHWGKILGYHRKGGPHPRVRDVIGISHQHLIQAAQRGQQ